MAQVASQQEPPSMQQPRDVPLADTANQAGGANTTSAPRGDQAGQRPSSGGGSAGGPETSEKPDAETPTGDGLGGASPPNKSDNKGRSRGRRGGQKYGGRRGGGSSGSNRSGNRQGNSRGGGGGKANSYRNKNNYGGGRKNYNGGGFRGPYKNRNERVLHVSAQSPVKQVAGAIAWISREGECPKILATAAPAINQAVKACAIARQFMSEDKIEVSVYPEYTRGRRRDADSFTFDLRKSVTRYQVVVDESMQELKVSKESKAPTVAGAIAGRVREGQRVILSAIGPLSVAAAVRSVAIARQYLAEDGVDISFRPSFMNIEFDDGRKSSCLNFQLLAQQV